MDKKRCKNATTGKCPDDECPHFWEHEKRYDCHLCCNSFLEDDTPCESVKPEPIEPQQPAEKVEVDIRGILQTAVWDGGFVTLDNEDELVSAFLKLLQEQKP